MFDYKINVTDWASAEPALGAQLLESFRTSELIYNNKIPSHLPDCTSHVTKVCRFFCDYCSKINMNNRTTRTRQARCESRQKISDSN